MTLHLEESSQVEVYFTTASSTCSPFLEDESIILEETNSRDTSHYFVRQTEASYSTAQIELGKAIYDEAFAENNVNSAFVCFHRSAEQGNMEAQFKLGDLYALGHGTTRSIPDAYKWYTKSAIQGYKMALIRLHNHYQEDIRMHCRGQINSEEEEWASKNFKEYNKIRELNEYRLEKKNAILNGAIDYYTSQFKHYQSSNQEYPAVQLHLAFFYQHGYGVKKYTKWAFKYYTLAAEQGNNVAQYNLGVLYQKHTNMKFNYRHALRWYTESAQDGNREAQRSLAYFYLKGLATDIDYGVALSWYTKAAEAGDSVAQVTLGKLYRKGDCIKQDLSMAVKWYTLAARQGSITAQNCLSQLQQRGILKDIDLEEDMSVYTTENSMNSRLHTKLSADISKLGDLPNFMQLTELGRRALIGDGQAMHEIGLRYLNGDKELNQDQDTGIAWIKNAAYAKHKEAQVKIADLYKKGDLIKQDYHSASIWYKKLAKQKDANAQCNVGILYNEGLGVRQDPLEASKWFIWAADQGNSHAQYNLGRLRLDGKGLRQDEDEAVKWFYQSAQQKNIHGCYRLGEIYFEGRYEIKKNSTRGLNLMEFAANNGSIQAQLIMAHRFEIGADVKKSIQKSIKYYTMAADAGSLKAQFQLVIIYLKEPDVKYSYLGPYILLKQAKDQGYTDAERMLQFPYSYDSMIGGYFKVTDMIIKVTEKGIDDLSYYVGYIFEYGARIHGPKYADMNFMIAAMWYSAASNNGDSRADYRLGMMHEYGRGVDKNLNAAIDHYKKASVKGNKAAIYRLASMYCYGYGVAQNFLEAFKHYTKASILGHQEAREALILSEDNKKSESSSGNGKYKHLGITGDLKIIMLKEATKNQYTQLQYQIGVWYEKNENNSEALKWFQLAADIGVTDAYYRLGVFYEEGKGTEQSFLIAADMYHKATVKEQEDACYRLGRLYQHGKGVKLDYLKAYQFYKKAATMGHAMAQKVLNITLDNKIISNGFFSPSSQIYQDSLLMFKGVAEHGNTEVQFQTGFAYEYSVSTPNYLEAYKWYSMAAKESHREAMYHLGLLYEKGLGVSCNYQIANQLYCQASELGSGDAFYQLGNLFRYGKGLAIDHSTAIEYYTIAAELGNPEHQCLLGSLYDEGELVPKNLLEAIKWYTNAYLQGYDGASSKIYSMYQDKPYEAFFFKRLFKNLSVASCGHFRLNKEYTYSDYGYINKRLVILCNLGLGTDKDVKKSLYYFLKKYHEYHSTFSLEAFLDVNNGANTSEKSDTLEIIGGSEEILNSIKDVEEIFKLGIAFSDTIVQIQDGYISIADQAKLSYFGDTPIMNDHSRALRCLKNAAKRKHPEAIVRLGVMYHFGCGVVKNSGEGDRYFAGLGSENIKFVKAIAILYHSHEEMQNLKKAFEWYKKLEKMMGGKKNSMDYITLQLGLGLLYEYGDGVEQDYQKALGYYETITRAKISIGFHRLALMHYYGKGVRADYGTSLKLFNQAMTISKYETIKHFVYQQKVSSELNPQANSVYFTMSNTRLSAENSYYLGLHYKNGQGVLRNQRRAQQYFREAYENGCQHACNEFTAEDSNESNN